MKINLPLQEINRQLAQKDIDPEFKKVLEHRKNIILSDKTVKK